MARRESDNPDVEAVNSGSTDQDPPAEPETAPEAETNTAITDETANPDAAVADDAETPTASYSPEDKKLLGQFLKLSGYKRADIFAWSNERRTVVVKNGSKYQVSKKGTQLKILMGAVPPAATEA